MNLINVLKFAFAFLLIGIGAWLFRANKEQVISHEPQQESFNYFDFKVRTEASPFEAKESNRFYLAFLRQKQIANLEDNSYRTNDNWDALGPFEIAGRSLALAINPKDTSELWLGMAGSGLWKSNSGGLGNNAWKNVKTGYPVQAVPSIAIHPKNSDVLYIGTGELYNAVGNEGFVHNRILRGSRGIGILKTIDGGKHWDLVYDYSQKPNSCVWKICIHPTIPNIIYASTTEGVLKSTNDGQDWSWIFTGGIASDMALDPIDPNTIYLGVGGIGSKLYGLYKSNDSGAHWEKIETPAGDTFQGRVMVHIHPIDHKRVIAAFSDDFKSIGIARTIDGFEQTKYYTKIKDVCEHQGWYAKGLMLKIDDPDKLLMGGVDLYYDSTGSGNKFLNLIYNKLSIHADFHDIISNPLRSNTIYFATDGGIYRSDDFAKTVYECNSGLLSAQFYNGSVSKRTGTIMGGLQDNGTVLLDAHGWKNFKFGDGTFNAFDQRNDSSLYLSTQYQNLYKSINYGQQWTKLISPIATASFVAPFLIHPLQEDFIISGGNNLLISKDGGNKWNEIALSSDDMKVLTMEFNLNNTSPLFYSTLNINTNITELFKMDLNAVQSTKITGNWNGRIIRDLAFSSLDKSLGYLALGGYGSSGIMISHDSGNSFDYPMNTSLPDVAFHAVLCDPKHPSIVYAGCDLGLYVSYDYGKQWESYNAHPFDLVPVYDLKYSEFLDRILIFSHGYGLFSCKRLELPITGFEQNSKKEVEVFIYSANKFIHSITLPRDCSPALFDLNGKTWKVRLNENRIDLAPGLHGIYFLSIKAKQTKTYKLFIP